MKILNRLLYWLTILTPCLLVYCYFIIVRFGNDGLLSFLWLWALIYLFLAFFAASRLIVYLLPYHFQTKSKKIWYQTGMNMLLLLPPIAIQITLWLAAILITFPTVGMNVEMVTSHVLGYIVDFISAILNGSISACVALALYLLLFAAYVIIGRIRNNRKEQTS